MKSERFENGEASPFGFNKISARAFCRKKFLPFALRFSLLVFSFSLFAVCAFAQDGEASYQEPQPEDAVPPPLKIIPKQEKSTLDAEADISERTKMSLDLMETHIKRAEDLYAQNSLDQMFGELGGFDALVDDALDFLKKNVSGRGKALNNYKKLEICLRRFSPRIELIRRELPAKYEYYVRGLIKNVRAARSKAVEPLFADTVVPNE